MSETPITVGRLRALLELYDDRALVAVSGDGPLVQVTEEQDDAIVEPARPGEPPMAGPPGLVIVTLSASRL